MPPILMLGETIERTSHRQQNVILLSMSSEGAGLGFVRGLHTDTLFFGHVREALLPEVPRAPQVVHDVRMGGVFFNVPADAAAVVGE